MNINVLGTGAEVFSGTRGSQCQQIVRFLWANSRASANPLVTIANVGRCALSQAWSVAGEACELQAWWAAREARRGCSS